MVTWALRIPVNKLHLKHQPFQGVLSFSQGYAGGVNFGYFHRSAAHPQGSSAEGAFVADGVIGCDRFVPGRPALMHVPGDGLTALRIQDVWGINPAFTSAFRILAQAGPWLVKDGTVIASYGDYPGVNPAGITERAGVGILDQQHVVVAVGKCSLPVLGRWFAEHSCANAVAGDGGSSVSLVVDKAVVYGSQQLVPNALVWDEAEVLVKPGMAITPPVDETPPDAGLDVGLWQSVAPGAYSGPFYVAQQYPKGYVRPNFEWREFACKGTGRLLIARYLVDMCQYIRTKLGGPFVVNSAYRAPSHNARVGGEPDSLHTMGLAVDLSTAAWGETRIVSLARDFGWRGGLGHYAGFVHLDIGPVREWRG